ncbi:MAG: hypothetical protein OXE75_17855, partial [bacterium]|nr:hypothetical protein [bacterium]
MTAAAPKLPLGIDGGRADLFEEFMRRPFGRHSPDLQSLLNYMRGIPLVGKHFLLMTRSNTEWMLARFTEGDPLGVERLPEVVFDDIEEAERYVFRLRWGALFGGLPPSRQSGEGRNPSSGGLPPSRHSGEGRDPAAGELSPSRQSGGVQDPAAGELSPTRHSGEGRYPAAGEVPPSGRSGEGGDPAAGEHDATLVDGALEEAPVTDPFDAAGFMVRAGFEGPELLAYADRQTLRAGEEINFKASCSGVGTYTLDIVRLLSPDLGDGPDVPPYVATEMGTPVCGEHTARHQDIHPGSYVAVPAGAGGQAEGAFTIVLSVFPTLLAAGHQMLFGTYCNDTATGAGLFVGPDGRLGFVCGDGMIGEVVHSDVAVAESRWSCVAVSCDGSGGVTFHAGGLASHHLEERGWAHEEHHGGPVAGLGEAPILIGAEQTGAGHAVSCFNGRLERPRLFGRALSDAEIEAIGERGPAAAADDAVGDCVGSGVGDRAVAERGPGVAAGGAGGAVGDCVGSGVGVTPGVAERGPAAATGGAGVAGGAVGDCVGSGVGVTPGVAERGPAAAADDAIGDWDFSVDIGSEDVRDVSGNERHGTIVNMPTRGVGGSNWSGRTADWRVAPEEYGAIHFHNDDISDACWETTQSLRVPTDWASGCYAGRFRAGEAEFWVPFAVRPAADAPTSDVAFLLPTATYGAYANLRMRVLSAFNEMIHGRLTTLDETDLLMLRFGEIGGCTYDNHADGSTVVHSSMHRPVTNFRPHGRMYKFCQDLLIVAWLERTGTGYDVITDDDVDREGLEALAPYRVLVTSSHPEYTSTPMMDAVEGFVRGGGRLVNLGGNTYWHRIAYHPTRSGMTEVRRPDLPRLWRADASQGHDTFTGEAAGTWIGIGRGPHTIGGVGFITQGFDTCSYYRRTTASGDPRAAFIFEGVDDEIIADFGILQGGAAGYRLERVGAGPGAPRPVVARGRGSSSGGSMTRSSATSGSCRAGPRATRSSGSTPHWARRRTRSCWRPRRTTRTSTTSWWRRSATCCRTPTPTRPRRSAPTWS